MKERTVRCPACHTEVGVRTSGVLRQHGDRGGRPCRAGGTSAETLPPYTPPEAIEDVKIRRT